MKTIKILTGMLFTVLFGSCETEVVHNHHINLDGLDKEMTFVTASLSECPSRTVLVDKTNGNGKTLLWSKGDKIRVSDGVTEAVYTTDADAQAVAEFTNAKAGLSGSAVQYTAFYPETFSSSNLTLPAVQQYVKDGMAGFPMMALSSTRELSFRNLCGVICLRIKTNGGADVKLAKIVLESPGNGLSGKFTLDGYKAIVSNKDADLTLECGDDVTVSDASYTDFYLYLPDGQYTTMYLTLAGMDGSEVRFKSCGTISVTRSTVTAIPLVLDTMHFNGSLEDLPVVDDGTGFEEIVSVTDVADGVFPVCADNVDYSTR